MRILIAPASFKETLSAREAAEAMKSGVQDASGTCEVELCPVGDGGESTLEAIEAAMGLRSMCAEVEGPMGGKVRAKHGISADGELAVIELAQAAGLMLVGPGERNAMRATTYGVGELMRRVIEQRKPKRMLVLLGGSATVDGGTGMMQALGVRFLDAEGRAIEGRMNGGKLGAIKGIDRRGLVRLPRIDVACDVTNELLGPRGAVRTFAKQKGATDEQVEELEEGMGKLARAAGDPGKHEGDGAAGGAGYGLRVMGDGTLERGIDLVLEMLGFRKRCVWAEVVMTGEGRLDGQSAGNKACVGVARAAREQGKAVIGIFGSIQLKSGKTEADEVLKLFAERFSLTEAYGMKEAMGHARERLRAGARSMVETMMGRKNRQ